MCRKKRKLTSLRLSARWTSERRGASTSERSVLGSGTGATVETRVQRTRVNLLTTLRTSPSGVASARVGGVGRLDNIQAGYCSVVLLVNTVRSVWN